MRIAVFRPHLHVCKTARNALKHTHKADDWVLTRKAVVSALGKIMGEDVKLAGEHVEAVVIRTANPAGARATPILPPMMTMMMLCACVFIFMLAAH